MICRKWHQGRPLLWSEGRFWKRREFYETHSDRRRRCNRIHGRRRVARLAMVGVAFISDGSAVAWLSSALLVANAAVALSVTLMRALPLITGGCLAAALALLAVDEQFQLHEQFKNRAGTTRFSEAPMVMVGIGAVVVLVVLWRRLPTRTARVLFASAVSVGVFALWVDLGSPPVVVGQLEEGFEVLSESLFLCGLLELARVQVQSGAER